MTQQYIVLLDTDSFGRVDADKLNKQDFDGRGGVYDALNIDHGDRHVQVLSLSKFVRNCNDDLIDIDNNWVVSVGIKVFKG